jgi:AcrR family transcriptional regulator
LTADLPSPLVPAARPTGGLRERKKQKTREAIQREAMRLFEKQGYDETTIEQIAEAADISPSTFFNYFPTKEDVVLFDRYDPIMVSIILRRPANEPLSVTVRETMHSLARVIDPDRDIVLARAKLGLEVPALRARFWGELEKARDLIASVIASRSGRDPEDFEIRVLAMAIVTASFEASLEWVRQQGRGDMFELVTRAIDVARLGDRLDELTAPASVDRLR